ncbi:hypothetical protein BT96DRAFT_1101879 [Gymnopus androsaceus JB14]|uniref:Uncharacterized protein n=1 Tax=Gymnopus androsaceus JB14 TaxID=1447944 RepID=A0A6A4GEV0_9AGAR|nr:hypothetical protein BT96DRAFT_1101879 [Gymnopus androsaceus JB14]
MTGDVDFSPCRRGSDMDVNHIRTLRAKSSGSDRLLTGGVGDTVCKGCSYTRMRFTSTSYGYETHPYPARLAATASLTGGVGDTVCRRCSYTWMCFTSTSYGYETHPYPARDPSRLAATASLTGGVGDTVCRGFPYTRMCFTSISYGYETHPYPAREPSHLAATGATFVVPGGSGGTTARR